DASQHLIFVLLLDGAVGDLAARIIRLRQEFGDRQSRSAESAGRDLLVLESAAIGIFDRSRERRTGAEIARQHLRGGDEPRQVGWIGTELRPLISGKKEQLVLSDRPPDGPAVLIPFQRVAPGREE